MFPQTNSMMPYLQMLMQNNSQNPFASPGYGMTNNAPQIPLAQRQNLPFQQPQLPQQQRNGQPPNTLGNIVQTGNNISKINGWINGNPQNSANGTDGSSAATNAGGQQMPTSGLTPNYPQNLQIAPGMWNNQAAMERANGPLYQTPYQAQQAQPWYKNISDNLGITTSPTDYAASQQMYGQGMGANGMQNSAGIFGSLNGQGQAGAMGTSGDMSAQGLSTPGATGVGSGGTSSMFGSTGASGAGAADSSPSWLQSLWSML